MSDNYVIIQLDKNNSVVLNTPENLIVSVPVVESVISSGGYQGIQGPPGPQGLTGAEGPQGPQGPQGAAGVIIIAPASTNLSGHRAVVLNSLGEAVYADNNTAAHANKFAGVTQGASITGASATLQQFGEMTEPSWSWTPDQPVYLGANGFLTQTMPVATSAKFSLIIGVAQTATKLFISPMPPIFIV